MRVWLVDALVLASLVVLTLAVAGLWRMPTTRLRLHSASKASAVGIAPLAVAAAVSSGVLRALLVAVFVVLTTPISAHVLAEMAESTDEGEEPG